MKLTDGDIVELEGGATVQLTGRMNGRWFARPVDPETLRRDDSGAPWRVGERIRSRVCSAAKLYGGATAAGAEYDPLTARRTR